MHLEQEVSLARKIKCLHRPFTAKPGALFVAVKASEGLNGIAGVGVPLLGAHVLGLRAACRGAESTDDLLPDAVNAVQINLGFSEAISIRAELRMSALANNGECKRTRLLHQIRVV